MQRARLYEAHKEWFFIFFMITVHRTKLVGYLPAGNNPQLAHTEKDLLTDIVKLGAEFAAVCERQLTVLGGSTVPMQVDITMKHNHPRILKAAIPMTSREGEIILILLPFF
jgi:hypothetical protein